MPALMSEDLTEMSDECEFEIDVRTLDAKTVSVKGNASMTLAELKASIQIELALESAPNLVFKDVLLDNPTSTLLSLGITALAVVHIA